MSFYLEPDNKPFDAGPAPDTNMHAGYIGMGNGFLQKQGYLREKGKICLPRALGGFFFAAKLLNRTYIPLNPGNLISTPISPPRADML